MEASKEKYVVRSTASLREALALIDENSHRSLIVVSPDGFVVGTLSDGDARKALLADRILEIPVSDVMNTNFISVGEEDRDRAPELQKKYDVFLIPVLDEKARLLDVID